MHDHTKRLRPWLESWGAWRRMKLITDYPISSVSCNPDLHIGVTQLEPSFRMPAYIEHLTPEENAERMQAHEKRLREYYHIKRTETTPKRKSRSPDYDMHWRLNFIDREILLLNDKQREVITLRYEREVKVKEIPYIINRKLDAVNKRLSEAHYNLKHIPRVIVSRESYSFYIENCKKELFAG